MKKPKFKIGQTIYHSTPDSDVGIITNIIYYYGTDKIVYEIAVGWTGEHYCCEWELSEDKIY